MDTGELTHWAASDWASPLILDDTAENTADLDWWAASDWAPPILIPSGGGAPPATANVMQFQVC